MGDQYVRGANVAYSLYGSKSGLGGCRRSTFINSFYTLDGIDSFLQSIGYAIKDVYNYGDGDNQGGCTSALMCGENNQESNTFIQASFTDGMCNLSGYSETTDTLSSLNSALEEQSCVKISQYTAFFLLTKSQACTVLNGRQCPDPNGVLAECEAKHVEFNQFIRNEGNHNALSHRYVVLGCCFFLVALGIAGHTFILIKKRQGIVDFSYQLDDDESHWAEPEPGYAPKVKRKGKAKARII